MSAAWCAAWCTQINCIVQVTCCYLQHVRCIAGILQSEALVLVLPLSFTHSLCGLQPAVTLATCLAHQGPVQHVTFAPTCIATPTAQSGPLLITTSDDWTVGLWDASNGSSKATCIGHAAAVTALQLVQGSSATRLVTGAADGSVGVWGVGGEVYSLSQPHAAPVQLLAATSDAIITGKAYDLLFPGCNLCMMHRASWWNCWHSQCRRWLSHGLYL